MRMSDWSSDVCSSDLDWEDVSDGATLGLEIGYGLIGLVDDRKGAPLMARITAIRRQLSRALGFVVPLVRVKDNLALEPHCYRITIAGVIVGEDEIWPAHLLALDNSGLEIEIPVRKDKAPSGELASVWMTKE